MRLRTAFSLMACICVLLFSSRDAFAAKIFVTYTDQKVAGQGTGGCSLQEAIYSSVLHDTLDGVHGLAITSTDPDGFVTTDCVKGDGDDTIVLPTNGTMTMNADVSWDAYNPFGPTATPLIYSTITIEGNGATIVAQYSVLVRHFRLFAIGAASVKTPNGTAAGTGTLTLRNVQITGFHVKGGNGNNGGGGGLGAGGAIYVGKVNTNALPTLTIENSTFDSNGANGGLGGGGLGGGGGGMGGNGGPSNAFDTSGGGGARGDGGTGGGGGTVFPGVGLNGGYLNGGDGAPGFDVIDGDPAKGPGGGGGSGRERLCDVPFVCSKYGNGGPGGYGGGGGGGMNNGGAGGFGGGGGSSFSFDDGGHGGFGGGGGSGSSGAAGGAFGGHAADSAGGGGGALGGAIFNDGGTITVRNSTFLKNFVSRGTGGLACAPDVPDVCDPPGENGGDAGGAIFSRDGNLTVENSTFSANESTGSGGAIVDYSDFSSASGPFLVFTLNNTIIANNGANECFFTGDVTAEGLGNLITANGTGVQPFGSCPSPDVTADPQLGLLQDNGGFTQTMAIPFGGVAMGAADPSTSLATDQRGETRPQANGFDIGAYEVCRKSLGEMIVPFACSETTFNGSSTSPLTIAATSSSGAGGTVSPVPGTYDEPKDTVVLLTATPSAGYYLKSWTGNVAAPNITTTTIIIGDVAQSVTANFQLHDFTLAASPTTFTIPLGATTLTSGLTATALGDFGDSISLTAAGQPAGVKASLSANPLKPVVGTPAASTLTIAVGPSAVPQSFAETITGRSTGLSGALSHPAQVNVTFVMTAAALINIIKQDLALGCIGTSGLAQALIAKVNAFQTLSSTGQKQAAANLLVAFQNEVLGQTGRQIAATCTDPVGGNQFSAGQTLIVDAQALQAGTLGSQVKGMPIVGLVLNSVNTEVQGATVNLMSSSNTVIATATTDAAGFYSFIGTSGMTVGADYSVSVATKKSGSTIPSQTLAWGAATTVLKTFILN